MTTDKDEAIERETAAVIDRLRSTQVSVPTFEVSVAETVSAARRARKVRSVVIASMGVAASVMAILAAVAVAPQLPNKPSGGDDVASQVASKPEGQIRNDGIPEPGSAVPSAADDDCGGEKDQEAHSELRAAESPIARLEKGYAANWSGAVPCWKTNTMTVWRIPGSGLDERARQIASEYDIMLQLVDTKYSEAQLTSTVEEIRARSEALAECGARVTRQTVHPFGLLEIAVAANSECASQVLNEFSDQIKIVVADAERVVGPLTRG